jgi:hypothetical protein
MEACAAACSRATVIWDYRSLESFGGRPLAELADRYDLVVIDYPNIGEAVEAECQTFQNSAHVISIGIFFTLMISSLAATLPQTIERGTRGARRRSFFPRLIERPFRRGLHEAFAFDASDDPSAGVVLAGE